MSSSTVKYPISRVHVKWVETSHEVQRLVEDENKKDLELPTSIPIAAVDLLYVVTERLLSHVGNEDVQYTDLLEIELELFVKAVDLSDAWDLNIFEDYFDAYFRFHKL